MCVQLPRRRGHDEVFLGFIVNFFSSSWSSLKCNEKRKSSLISVQCINEGGIIILKLNSDHYFPALFSFPGINKLLAPTVISSSQHWGPNNTLRMSNFGNYIETGNIFFFWLSFDYLSNKCVVVYIILSHYLFIDANSFHRIFTYIFWS